ncbi:hypothetical protein AGDE_02319 [Angomonas deanei]|uniref:Prefoldin subunit, putative n=1 Tax=Angomonas deanei TaxID=59799 RepID=A0A7G2CT47_9TRYP|nr:hypothetical protein AGDE_02319 [Angomonas deanei]CAD2222417.1 Prefoldin subunit, putative [Angomonas deanei]|eukprot:EPY41605.1 hypothetical protein AGDE_02319 [Angomonas deanei]
MAAHPDILKMRDQLTPIINEIQALGEKKGKLIDSRRQLDGQKNENELVLEEMGKLESDAMVYKLIGPALVPQDQADAKNVVSNRLEYINGELKRTDASLSEVSRKQTELEGKARQLYQKMMDRQAEYRQQQQAQAQAAANE